MIFVIIKSIYEVNDEDKYDQSHGDKISFTYILQLPNRIIKFDKPYRISCYISNVTFLVSQIIYFHALSHFYCRL